MFPVSGLSCVGSTCSFFFFLELEIQPSVAFFCLWSLNVDGDVPLRSNYINQCRRVVLNQT